MKRIQFFVEESVFEKIEQCAKKQGLTIDNMVRHATYQYVNKNTKNKIGDSGKIKLNGKS